MMVQHAWTLDFTALWGCNLPVARGCLCMQVAGAFGGTTLAEGQLQVMDADMKPAQDIGPCSSMA